MTVPSSAEGDRPEGEDDHDTERARELFDLVEPIALDVSLTGLALTAGREAARSIGDVDREAHWAHRMVERVQMEAKWRTFQDDEDARFAAEE